MAKNYVEVLAVGSFKLFKGFVVGYFFDRREDIDFFFSRDLYIHARSVFQKIKDHISSEPEHVHLVIQEDLVEELQQALLEADKCIHVQIRQVRKLKGAFVHFTLSAYRREDAERLMRLIKEERPAEIELVDYEESEPVIDPEGKGQESYAPLHEYEVHAAGKLVGDVDRLCKYAWMLRKESLLTLKEIQLVHIEDDLDQE